MFQLIFHHDDDVLHLCLVAFTAGRVDFAAHFLCDEAQFLAHAAAVFVHCFAEIAEVIGQPLFLFADVQLLNIIDQLLLQTVFVVVDTGDLLQSLDDILAYFLRASLFIRLDAGKKTLDIVNLFVEFQLQGRAFLLAKSHQSGNRFIDGLQGKGPLLVGELLHIGLRSDIGQVQQRVEPIGWFGDTGLRSNGFELPVVVFYEGSIDGCRIDDGLFLDPNRKVHLAPLKAFGNQLAYFHLLFPVEWRNTGSEIQGLTVERFDLNINLLLFKDDHGFAVTCHGLYHDSIALNFCKSNNFAGKKRKFALYLDYIFIVCRAY